MKKPFHKLDDYLKKIADKLEHPKPLLEGIVEAKIQRTKLQFREEKDPYGETWVKGKKPVGKTLTETKVLANSITGSASDHLAIVGTDVEYAKQHQEGVGGLPKRQIVGWTHLDEPHYQQAIKEYWDD